MRRIFCPGDLVPSNRSKAGSAYKLVVTNISKELLLLGAQPVRRGRTISWERTDTYYSSAMEGGPYSIYPAFHAVITGEDGKSFPYGAETIRNAIQNPTGKEESFCTILPGESIVCGFPFLDRKPRRAEFHFLQNREGKMVPIKVPWSPGQPPAATWLAATGCPIPETDAGRIRLYEVPFAVFDIRKPDLPAIEGRRHILDLKPWCEQNGLVPGEIDFAFYDFRSGFCLIATSEANHLKLKELHFERH